VSVSNLGQIFSTGAPDNIIDDDKRILAGRALWACTAGQKLQKNTIFARDTRL
jgi:hypothetical protein